jgi:O-6-methylguanine DNA methyltransferase
MNDEFAARVMAVVRRIPPGRVATYGDVATMAGRPGAARAVGRLMAQGTVPGLPYHRVVSAGGRLGGYGSGLAFKAELLRSEGLTIRGDRIANFAAHRVTVTMGRQGNAEPTSRV